MSSTNTTPKRTSWWLELLIVLVVLYIGVAHVVFALRHPWMTQTERLLWTGSAMTWATVTTEQVRG